ncbi:MAG: hypothetical protein ACOVMI_09380 [Chitinophagaceae bacterium]
MKKIVKAIFIFSFIVFKTSTLKAQATVDSVKTAIVKVSGIHCEGDMPEIKELLINKEGIDDVLFTSLKNGSSNFTIIYHTSVLKETQFKAIIEKIPSCSNAKVFPYKVKNIAIKNN